MRDINTKPHTFDLLAEAACCIWEYMIECRIAAGKKRATDFSRVIDRHFQARGSVEMRHVAIDLAELCCDVFDIVGVDMAGELDLIPYDWEFVPAFVHALDWEGEYAPFHGKPVEIANAITSAALESKKENDVLRAGKLCRLFKIEGSYGTLHARVGDGVVVEGWKMKAGDGMPEEYADILRVDVADYCEAGGVAIDPIDMPEAVDILQIGFWTKCGSYQQPPGRQR